MRQYKIHPIWTILLLLLVVGCKKDMETISLLAQLEQIDADAEAKSYLQNESWIYWDQDDRFSISTDLMVNKFAEEPAELEMRDGSYFNAVFNVMAPEGSQKFIALFPEDDNHRVLWQDRNLSSLKVNIPATQDFRNDSTFGKEAMPMVAYEPYGEVLHFHSLGGIVRIQLYGTGNTGSNKIINSIEFEELNGRQISGLFNVNDWDQFEPYLSSAASDENSKKITINCGEGRRIASGNNGFLTFYLVLPAYQPQRMSDNTTGTPYKLQMTVNADDGTHCVKTFSAMIRRNGLTMLRALEINQWTNSGNGSANVQLVGNGTQARPFKIYTVEDLVKVRNAFNADANQGTINGMQLSANTYFELMRNDIELTRETWTEGIRNFVGHFVFKANTASTEGYGIRNNSAVPIFESIAQGGVVEGFAVKGTVAFNMENYNGNFYFSPICGTNNGDIKDCIVTAGSQISAAVLSSTAVESVGVAGICVENHGRIVGCSNQGSMSAPNRLVAGICLFNRTGAKIVGCNIISPTRIQAARIGGICYANEGGHVRACYTAFNTASSQNPTNADWGGIVYENKGAVTNCYLMQNGVINTTKSVGGIVHTNTGDAIIDTCRNYTTTIFAQGVMGGIVAYLNGGEVRNSYCDIPNSTFWFESTATLNAVGGLVGVMAGGTLKNCYSHVMIYANTGAQKGSVVGNVTGGNIANCFGWNNVPSSTPFYGATSNTPSFSTAYNYVSGSSAPFVPVGSTTGDPCSASGLVTKLNNALSNTDTNYMQWEKRAEHPIFKK